MPPNGGLPNAARRARRRLRKRPRAAPRPRTTKKAKPKSPRVVRRIRRANEERERHKNPADAGKNGNGRKPTKQDAAAAAAEAKKIQIAKKSLDGKKDRIVLLVRDAYWLQTMWELTRPSVERAKAAMAEHWHTAKPVIRLIEMDSDGTTSSAECVARQIEIHGGVRTWYIDVHNSPKSFRVDIGYLAANDKFFTLALKQHGHHTAAWECRRARPKLVGDRGGLREDLRFEWRLLRRQHARAARVV